MASTATTKLRVVLLASEWGSKRGGLSTLNRELAIQLAKHPDVQVSVFLPRCNQEEKDSARNNRITLVQATRMPGYDEIDWLCSPPDELQMDFVVGHGVVLGRQAQLIRRGRQCKWIQFVHTDPEELGMFKEYPDAISKGEKKHRDEVDLCVAADFVVAVGPKLAEAYRSYLRYREKDQNVFVFTPGIFSEFSDVTQSKQDGGKCHLKHLFSEVDLAIMPSRTEALEALSAGLPVLVSANSGFGEALGKVPFGSACVVRSEDAGVWAEKIKNVWQKDREIRRQESEELRASYDKKYNWEKKCGDLLEKMRSFLNGTSAPKLKRTSPRGSTQQPSKEPRTEQGTSVPEVEQQTSVDRTGEHVEPRPPEQPAAGVLPSTRAQVPVPNATGTSEGVQCSNVKTRTVKQGNPTADDLELLSLRLGDKWEKLGRHLGFDRARRTAYHKENEKLDEKAYNMLMDWKEREGSAATYQVLYNALCKDVVACKGLAEELCCVQP